MAPGPANAQHGPRRLLVQRLPVGRLAPAAARRALGDLGLPPELLDDARLVLSELVSNGVVHSGASEPLDVFVDLRAGTLRIEVRDGGPGFGPPMPPRPDPGGEGGRGLVAVHRIADRWGVERDGGTRVWVELWHGASVSRHHPEAPAGGLPSIVALDSARLRHRREELAARRQTLVARLDRLAAGHLATQRRGQKVEQLLSRVRVRAAG